MTKFAFYKAPGTMVDLAIRVGSKSQFSHVELIGTDKKGWSSSQRDGGVRVKEIDFYNGDWDILDVTWADTATCMTRIEPHLGKKYDYAAIVLSHMLAVERHTESRWICSELMAHSLELPASHTYSPGRLYDVLKFIEENTLAR